MKSAQKRFQARLEAGLIPLDYSEGRSWTAIRMPFDPVKEWPERCGMRVRGTLNGAPFRTSLFGTQTGSYLLLVSKAMQKEAKVAAGGTAEVAIEPDLEDRSADPPAELAKLLKSDRAVKRWFEKLNYSMRRYVCDAVAQRKSAEARVRCAERWVECMMLAMDGEVQVPPVLQFAFRRYEDASAGWDALTPIQRRNHLVAIFQLQGPEARAKRADRAAADAAGVLRKGEKEEQGGRSQAFKRTAKTAIVAEYYDEGERD